VILTKLAKVLEYAKHSSSESSHRDESNDGSYNISQIGILNLLLHNFDILLNLSAISDRRKMKHSSLELSH
jgi:hypothetical protein